MVTDLAFPVDIRVAATVRESDGLALSSRNVQLSGADRVRARVLHRALEAVRNAVADGEQDPAAARERALAELDAAGVAIEYLELVDPEALTPVPRLDREVLALVAARVGATRLIDNELIRPPGLAQATLGAGRTPASTAAGAANAPARARVTRNGRPSNTCSAPC
jgi:pantoate--beta-alanine ligase